MSKEIKVTETVKVNFDGYSYQPVLFKKGGELVRNPSTGDMIETKDKWVSMTKYFPSMAKCLEWVAVNTAVAESDEIKSYIAEIESILNGFNEALAK